MDGARWQEMRSLFDAVCELPASHWEPRLRTLTDDDELRAEALALLHAQTVGFERAVRSLGELIGSLSEDELQAGDRLGAWRLTARLASGGMGTVFVAERADGLFRQRVAIKLLRGSARAEEAERRLAAERQILAGLEHPSIARLYDGGTTPAGRPYLVMEYIDGLPLDAWCRRQALGLNERLRLFLRVCAPVQAAHARLVVHCDLKPSNVLVREGGEPMLLDFGIARMLEDSVDDAGTAGFCTLPYASPEQRRGARVGVASDIFSLGVLLTGLLADVAAVRDGADPDAPVPAPSALAGARCAWRHQLPGALDAIASKACAVTAAARYASVQEMAGDIEAWLDQRPVAAVGGGRRYRAGLFLRRHRLGTGLAVLALSALAFGVVVALWQARVAREQRDAALIEARKSRAVLEFMTSLFERADPGAAGGMEVTARELLAEGRSRIEGRFVDQPLARAELLGAMAAAHRGLGDYEGALPLAEEASILAERAGRTGLRDTQQVQHARILHHLGRYPEALALLDPMAERLRAEGADATIVAAAAHARGLTLQALNRLDEAEQAYVHAHRLRKASSGEGGRDSQDTALRLVTLYTLRRRYDEAAALARSTLEAVRRTAGPADPHLAEAVGALAMVLGNTGPLEEAEALRQEALAILEKAYGSDHPLTVGARNDLAAVLYSQGRIEDAAGIFGEVLEARARAFGPDHPAVATAANNLANAWLAAHRPEDALQLARRALEVRMRVYGADHHATAASLHTLGVAAMDLGDRGALDHLRRAVQSWESAAGAESSHAAGPLRDLARAQLQFDHPDPECAVIRRAQRLSGNQPPAAEAYLDALHAACRVAAGSGAAVADLAQSARALREHAGPGDPRMRRIEIISRDLRERSRRTAGALGRTPAARPGHGPGPTP